jgi:hypothetical protein
MARKAELKAVLKLDNIQFARTIRHSIQMAKDLAKQFARQPIRTSFLAGVFAARGAVKLTGKAIETFGRVTLGVFRSVATGSLLLKAAVVAAFGFFLHKVIEASAAAEDYRTVFAVLLGSAEKASKRMKELLNFANERGLRLTTVAEASRTLETLTRGALSTGKGLEMVGNIAAGTNTKFEDMAVTVGRLFDAMRTGQGGGESLMRLQDLGAITGQQRRRISALGQAKFGAQGWQEAQRALAKFDGLMKAKSTNWNMRMEKFRDSIEEAMRQFGTPLMEALKPGLTALTDVIFAVAPKLQEVGKAFGEAIQKGVGFLVAVFSDPAKLLSAFKEALVMVIGGAMKLFAGGFQVVVNYFSDGLMEGVVSVVQYARSAFLDAFAGPVAYLRSGLEKAVEVFLAGMELAKQSALAVAAAMNPVNQAKLAWSGIKGLAQGKGTTGFKNGFIDRIKDSKVNLSEFARKQGLAQETMASRKARYLDKGKDQAQGLRDKSAKNLSDSINGLIAAFKGTKIPEAVRTLSNAVTTVVKELNKKKEKEIPHKDPDYTAWVKHSKALRTSGLMTGGLKTSFLERGVHSRTPLIRYHERRAFDMAQRAGVQGILGGREPGDTKVRRGDRKRMQEAQRERLREKMGLDKTNSILEAIQKSFDTLVK